MKPGETQWHVQDIAVQPTPRTMQPMHTEPLDPLATKPMSQPTRVARCLLAVLLLGVGAAHAADTPETVAERPLDLSLPRDASARADPLRKPGDGRVDIKPYGSGYEARRLNANREGATRATEPAGGASAGTDGAGLRGAATGHTARAGGGSHRSGGAGGRGRR